MSERRGLKLSIPFKDRLAGFAWGSMDPDQAHAGQALAVVTLSTATLIACVGLLISVL
jgi:hypothetical protein